MWQYKKGLVFVISGPSGSGKSTLCHTILTQYNDFYFSISCTTRKKRQGEIEGKDYFFLDDKIFKKKINNREFLEYANVYGYDYGTLKEQVLNKIKQGINVIIDIDVQGAMQIKETIKNDEFSRYLFTYILIAPPTLKTLETRLALRATDSPEIINKRLSYAKNELSQWQKYDHLIINDKLEDAKSQLIAIIDSQHTNAHLYTQKKL